MATSSETGVIQKDKLGKAEKSKLTLADSVHKMKKKRSRKENSNAQKVKNERFPMGQSNHVPIFG